MASLSLTPLSELEAVNAILATIAESPIASFDESFADSELALNKLHSVSRAFQSEGWTFNTEPEYRLIPNYEGRIVLPAARLSVDIPDDNTLVERGQYLYDPVNRTYLLEREIIAEIVMFLPFGELPQAARHYVSTRASRMFQDNINADRVIYEVTRRDEAEALAAFLNDEARRADWNMLTGSQTIQRLIRRRGSG